MARVYRALYRLPISINLLWFSCGYTSHKLLAKQLSALLCLSGKIWQVRSNSKNEAKLLLHGHCPLCATLRFIGALVLSTFGPTCGPGPSKTTAFLGHCSPSHEAANDEAKRASPCCFRRNPRATTPIKPWNTRLSNNGVEPSEYV